MLNNFEKAKLLTGFTKTKDNYLVTVTLGDEKRTVSVAREAQEYEEAESLAISRASELLGKFGDSFKLEIQNANVVVGEKKSPATGATTPILAVQVSADLVIFDSEDKVKKQVVISRVGEKLEDVENATLAKISEVLGEG